MTFPSKTTRPQEPRLFQSYKAYVDTVAGKVGASFCAAVAAGSAPFKPWPTLVLGSGCPPSDGQALWSVAAQLGRSRPQESCSPKDLHGEEIQRVAQAYAEDLIRHRVGPLEQGMTPPSEGSGAPELFDLLVAAALLARAYYLMKAYRGDAPRRPHHEHEVKLKTNSRHWSDIVNTYVEPCGAILDSLIETPRLGRIVTTLTSTEMGDEGVSLTISSLLRGAPKKTRDGTLTVKFLDVLALSELSWCLLAAAAGGGVYPGWDELLLDLSIYDAQDDAGVGTPLFKSLTDAAVYIRARYLGITETAWTETLAGERADGVHSAAALVLQRQHESGKRSGEGANIPPVTAFITSFDLEVELALLARKQLFTMALPVHVVDTINNVAHTCWLALRVEPGELGAVDQWLDSCLLNPPVEGAPLPKRWGVLEEECGRLGPVIIRLAGCPLIGLPDLKKATALRDQLASHLSSALERTAAETCNGSAALQSENRKRIEENLRLEHAVVINEHDALLQSVLDVVARPGSQMSSGFGALWQNKPSGPGLPPSFAAGDSSQHYSRFWLLLGVQIHDSVVRQRIAAIMTSLPAMVAYCGDGQPVGSGGSAEADGADARLPRALTRWGLAVNSCSNPVERDLLFWNGLDVVEADVATFTKGLQHCALHLAEGQDFKLGGCDVLG